ncbi:hypothetical protein BDQ12DRAFT_736100 [Crucibulum laeve]|uniref:Eukaryotic translation initiation factor SUI1 family protein n=1 Tax=Crucibulum laeve TaxID=68775 RepID=A0A5C3LYC5_9AGAR|nr:hypothetical protein BDQ12DRAFT_736100 [Crucibulum laeve]
MFKKPLSSLKTSAPLKSSDRRKLKQRVITAYGISSEDGDLLVPDGILSVKFITHLNEPGTAYLAPEGDPLWFTVGKGADGELIPTTYTLWKKGDILPFLSTPSAVIPVLIGGADLMIPGVIHHTPSLNEGQLVAIRQYTRQDGKPTLSPPLAVGRMALPSDRLREGGQEKGKAVIIVHTWKDNLWDMGSKSDMPEGTVLQPRASEDAEGSGDEAEDSDAGAPPVSVVAEDDAIVPPSEEETSTSATSPTPSYTAQEITELLNKSILQVLSTTLASAPLSTFPIPATLFYTNYVLPSRPAFPTLIIPPSSASGSTEASTPDQPLHIDPQEINIKTSTHKSLTAFLKSVEKASLISLKTPQKHSQQTELVVTSVNAKNPSVIRHSPYVTVKDLELKAAKRAAREEKEKESQQGTGEIEIKELWKPHQTSLELFEGMGGNKSTLYTLTEIKSLINEYIASHNLVNAREQAYINLDNLFLSCIVSKSKGKSKGEEPANVPEFMKRDELTKKVVEKMQSWYEVRADGKDLVCKKGSLKPIQVVIKVRQGRKASTLITGFEPFLVLDADEMAEDLRKACAGATSVSPIFGKPANSGMEVLIQGKQGKAVTEYLTAKGIPKKWIEVMDISGKK